MKPLYGMVCLGLPRPIPIDIPDLNADYTSQGMRSLNKGHSPKKSSITETILFFLVQLLKNHLEMIWNASIFHIWVIHIKTNRFRKNI